jgi:putative ABC transport system permease protein
MVGPTARTSLLVLLGAVSVVLLIACANVANLFLVRAESRRRDMTVRRAIGASRTQLIRFQLAEALARRAAAGVLAVVLSALTLPLFLRAAPEGHPAPRRRRSRPVDHRSRRVRARAARRARVRLVPAMRASAPT